jgi:hypothetical protein
MAEAVGYLAAVFGELLHYGPVKRDIFLGTPVRADMDIQFTRQRLTGGEAGIHFKELQQVDD